MYQQTKEEQEGAFLSSGVWFIGQFQSSTNWDSKVGTFHIQQHTARFLFSANPPNLWEINQWKAVSHNMFHFELLCIPGFKDECESVLRQTKDAICKKGKRKGKTLKEKLNDRVGIGLYVIFHY